MQAAQWWSRLRRVRTFSLILLLLVGCGEQGDTSGNGTSQVVLHVRVAAQGRAARTSGVVFPEQTRQVENLRLLRIEVSGAGLPTPIVVNCPLPGGSPSQCQVTNTPDAITMVIVLRVPNGPVRQVVLTGFDQTGQEILRGTTTVNLTGGLQDVVVTITDAGVTIITVITGSGGGTSALRGNGSSDADGEPLPFASTLLTRPSDSEATVVQPIGVNPALVVDRPGTYMVQLSVPDGQMDDLPEVLTLRTVDVDGHVLALDADRLTFAWSLLVTPPDSTAVLSLSSAAHAALTVDRPGIYVMQLLVDDGRLDSAPGNSGE